MNTQAEFMVGDEFVSGELFDHGKKFYESYEILNNNKNTNLPALVCLAFSVEIFLKALRTKVSYKKIETFSEGIEMHQISDKSMLGKGHELSNLFNKLSSNVKNDMIAEYKIKYCASFEDDLNNVSSGFVDWRYVYEGKITVIYLSAIQNIGEFVFLYVQEKLNKTLAQ